MDKETRMAARTGWFRIANLLAWFAMIAVNILANALPIGGTTTGAVSDAYPNLFAPAGITFSIWGLIYILQGMFALAPFGVFGGRAPIRADIVRSASPPFLFYCALNAGWLLAWHHDLIPLSMALMVLLLVCCAWAYRVMERFQPVMRIPDKVFVRLGFRVTFGWITVATVANAVTLLVSLGWGGWGIDPQVWLILVLTATLAIGLAVTLQGRDAAYGMVILWAYLGILFKHISASDGGFGRRYPSALICLIFCLILQFTAVILAIHHSRHRAGKMPEAHLLD
ncbi:MAG: tryptophan-rich sensory protein [Clostridia bacterium]|nr:tryptophan-rich sensory protein [Clostridia bacterium]